MRLIEIRKIDELIDLVEKLKAVIYLRSLLIEETDCCSIDDFSDVVKSADCFLSDQSEELIVNLKQLVTSDDFTKGRCRAGACSCRNRPRPQGKCKTNGRGQSPSPTR